MAAMQLNEGYSLIANDIEMTEGLNAAARSLGHAVIGTTRDIMLRHDALDAMTAFRILGLTRSAAPQADKLRNDRNSSYTHEGAQVYYLDWIARHPEDVLERVVQLRTGLPMEKAPAELVEKWRAQLAAELTPEEINIRIACAWLHDVVEDNRYTMGLTVQTVMNWMARGLAPPKEMEINLPIQTLSLQIIGRTLDALTRRPHESVEEYYERVTDDVRAAECKARDMLHNNATLFSSGKSRKKILKTLAERELFLQLCKNKLGGQSVMLEYDCAYIRDQNALMYTALHTDLSRKKAGGVIEALMDALQSFYKKSDIPTAIHPMTCIVARIKNHIARPFSNPLVSGPILAAAPWVPPSYGPLPPGPPPPP